MGKLYKSNGKVKKKIIQDEVSENEVEMQFIIRFFKSLPINDLKRLVKFNKIDPTNEALWLKSDNIILLRELEEEKAVMYTCKIVLDDDEDNLE